MESIAIIGLGCRFPGAPNPHVFWQLMCNGVDAITEVPADRYNIDAYYDPRPATPGKVMSRYGGFLDHVDQFDAAFFGISPREASKIDPQHRLLLEVAWEAMEDAGLVPSQMTDEDKLNIGCFIGVITGDYWDRQFQHATSLDVYETTGSARSGAAGRISFSQDLMGTSFAIDAACSSSLVAVDQAVQNLRSGACSIAVAGGVNVILNPDHTIGFSQGKMMAPDGHCKTYDAAADGYVRSEGAGVVILKRLSQALADGDQIYAIIRGSASNNDGHCDSFMAPSTRGQQAGLRKALKNAEVDPLGIHYVEAHGPGTKAGDPVEITTLGEVLCNHRPEERALLVGSVKTNIGHTEGAAGVTGIIKTALCLKYGMIPPNLHFHTPSPAIPWDKYALHIPTELLPWPQDSSGPRRAAVCSYGIAGTNTYVILEESPQSQRISAQEPDSFTHLLPLSAQTPQALKELAQSYVVHFEDQDQNWQSLCDISYTASLGRMHHEQRLAVVSHSREDAHDKLQAFVRGETDLETITGRAVEGKRHKVVWLFPGQGSQWLGMGRDLLEHEPVFHASIEACDRVMQSYVDWSLLEQLRADGSNSRLNEIDVIQPTLFAIEISLAALWRSWGIEPDAVVGHSMGETAAAYVAGILSLEDAAWIICSRSKLLLQTSGKGAMASVELSLEQARTLVSDYEGRVSVAVSNSPNSTVLSGDPMALNEILATLDQKGIFCRLVKVDVASHSPQMDPLRKDLLKQMARLQPHQGTTPMLSTVRGAFIDGSEMQAEYWVDNLREPVLFLTATQILLNDGFDVFMEMSPHPILVGAVRQTIEQSETPALALASMRRNEEGRAAMLATLGSLYVHGFTPKWDGVYSNGSGRHVSLPTYPWQRQRHWNEILDRPHSNTFALQRSDGTVAHPILNVGLPLALQDRAYCWTTEIDAERFPYLREHCVHNMPVLPGAGYIELSLAAATEIFGAQHFVVEDLVLKKVLFFPEGTSHILQVTLTPDEHQADRMVLQFYSTPGGQEKQAPVWQHHATASIRQVEGEPHDFWESMYLPTKEDQEKWKPDLDASTFYEGIRARGIQHGPRFQGVTQIWRNTGTVLARLIVPEAVSDDQLGYQVHPALMDAILQATIPFLPEENEEETYVPVAVRQIKLHHPLADAKELWSHALLTQAAQNGRIEGDIRLLDEHGRILLEVLGFRLQSLDGDTQGLMRQRLNQLVYTLQREEQNLANTPVQKLPRSRWLLFSDHVGPGQVLTAALRANGANCITITPGSVYKQTQEQHYEINPTDSQHFHQLLTALSQQPPIEGIVYLWGLQTTTISNESPGQMLTAQQDLASIGVLHLLQALNATKKETAPRFYMVTSGVHAQEEQGAIALSQATLWGLGRVIVYEHQDLHATLIDIDAAPSEENLNALYQEIASDNEEDEVLLHGPKRSIIRLAHHTLAEDHEQDTPLFRPDGTYLITGGLGGVGLRTAEWMIEQGAQSLVLMGRRGPSQEAQVTLQRMRDTGAAVNLLLADVSQEGQLARALAEIRRKLPPLRGIFHSAVVLDDSILLQLDQQRFLSVMPPKVEGAWNLHRLTLDDPLDYFVLFSSAASLIGSPGQGNYAAANAFMDQLAYYRRQQGRPALSINWGRWGEVGQAMKGDRGERLDVRGFSSMKPTEGLAILGSLLHQSPSQVGVMSFHLPKWSQFYPNLSRSSLFAHLVAEVQRQEDSQNEAQGSRLTQETLMALDDTQRQQALSLYITNQIARVLGHTSLALDDNQPINRLGIDSLMSVEIKNRIGADLNVTIPVAMLLQGATLGQLTSQVLAQI